MAFTVKKPLSEYFMESYLSSKGSLQQWGLIKRVKPWLQSQVGWSPDSELKQLAGWAGIHTLEEFYRLYPLGMGQEKVLGLLTHFINWIKAAGGVHTLGNGALLVVPLYLSRKYILENLMVVNSLLKSATIRIFFHSSSVVKLKVIPETQQKLHVEK